MIAIMAEATDGYRAACMLAEVDTGFGNRSAILRLARVGN